MRSLYHDIEFNTLARPQEIVVIAFWVGFWKLGEVIAYIIKSKNVKAPMINNRESNQKAQKFWTYENGYTIIYKPRTS